MKKSQIGIVEIVSGRPVIVRIVDVIYDELATWPDHKLIADGSADLLAESKRLNDQFNGRVL
jgi:hypothetical protein